jgi:predicted nucleic acid-binding protein
LTLSWCFEDEGTPAGDALLLTVRKKGVWVPNLWCLEVVNGLLQAKKRGRITQFQIKQKLELLMKIPVRVDSKTSSQAFTATLQLAEAEKLTSYDAAYLELAIRRKLPIATKDDALINACVWRGVGYIPLV